MADHAYRIGYRQGFESEMPDSLAFSFYRLEYIKGYVQGSIDRDKARGL